MAKYQGVLLLKDKLIQDNYIKANIKIYKNPTKKLTTKVDTSLRTKENPILYI